MDPISAITSITAAVLRRIANSIDNPTAALAEPITVHVHCHHDPIPRAGWRKR
ncbi:hypothetical protein G4X40_20240 [Rhodococcus sp. D2-41]|uniref:hypothetical protein n=1 Tax=Speluncibacter jeojiensis TaxID=2710754 RepID=UPI00240ECD9A|nr:hypothetical protein [Rhodococcus sp. D2-41]MDG3012473.1 hypothetical protein [Rhodococcus sp. D2-41]